MGKKKKTDGIKDLNFEDCIGQLTEIVDKIESGQTSLQDSLGQYEKGMALIKHCRGILQKAEKRIEKIASQPQGDENEDDDERDSDEQGSSGGLF